METLDEKYQRHLPLHERLRLYTEFMAQDGIGSILGAHLQWSRVELVSYMLHDCGFKEDEISKMLNLTQ